MTVQDDLKPKPVHVVPPQHPSLFEQAEAAIRESKTLVMRTKELLAQSRMVLTQSEKGKGWGLRHDPDSSFP